MTKQHFGDLLPVILPDDDDGVEGLVTTIDKPFSRLGHVDASFDEASTWDPVGERVRVAISLMGDHEAGPVVIVQRTEPGVLATPAMTFGSDVFRCVVTGSHADGERERATGDTRFHAAGDPWEAVIAGPEGLDEVIIVGDRRGGVPEVSGSDPDGWGAHLSDMLGRLTDRLAQLVPA